MDKRGTFLGWVGLIGGGLASVSMNIRSLWIPEHTATGWRSLPEQGPQDFGAIALAVFLPLAALVGVEMVNHWTHLHRVLRFGVLGLVAFSALAFSFLHVVTVFMWYGQHVVLAVLGTLAVDGIMVLSGLALFTKDKSADKQADTDTDAPVDVEPDTDVQPDEDTVPDMDTLPEPPVDIVDRVPAPRRPRPNPEWKVAALKMIETGEPATDREIAEKILADFPNTWTGKDPVEAGRKAVSRLR